MNEFELEELKCQFNKKVKIVDLLNEFISPVSYYDGKYSYCCPFHGEKTPSFFAFPDRNEFICYGCKKRGTPADFILEMKKQEGIAILQKYLEKKQQEESDGSLLTASKSELPVF